MTTARNASPCDRKTCVSSRSGFGLGLVLLLIFATFTCFPWIGGSNALAQEVFDAGGGGDDSVSSSGWGFDDWPVEVILLATGIIVVTIIVFSVIYQALLHRWYWPLNAYGISLFLIVTSACVWAAFLFWEDLLDKIPAPIRWVQKYGGVMILAVGWMLACSIILLLCRSNRGRVATR